MRSVPFYCFYLFLIIRYYSPQAFLEETREKRKVGMHEIKQQQKETIRKHRANERKRREDYIFEHTDDPDLEGAERKALRLQNKEEKALNVLQKQYKDAEQDKQQVGVELVRAENASKEVAREWQIAQGDHHELEAECEGARYRWRREKNPRMKIEFENRCVFLEAKRDQSSESLENVGQETEKARQWVERLLSRRTEAEVVLESSQFRIKQQKKRVERATFMAEQAHDAVANRIPRGMHIRAPEFMATPKVFTGKVTGMLKKYGTATTALKYHSGKLTHYAQRQLTAATSDFVRKRTVFRYVGMVFFCCFCSNNDCDCHGTFFLAGHGCRCAIVPM